MIECNKGCVKIFGTGDNVLKDWICITAAVHENLRDAVGGEGANELLTKSLFAAVVISDGKKESEE